MAVSFLRPVFIIASPRSGSTFLYESLARHPEFVSLHAESHAVIEQIPALSTVARGFSSNGLTREDATDEIRMTLTSRFLNAAKNHDGSVYQGSRENVRFLEKTPKNTLRVPFLHALYPDALFIYLVRQPVPNIASIMDAWGSGKFVTYPHLPGWTGPWSLLLPPGWQNLAGHSAADIAAFQWTQANLEAVSAFENIPASQVHSVNYDDLCTAPAEVINKICRFVQVSPMDLEDYSLPLSRYTLSAPSETKWHRHAAAIKESLSGVDHAVTIINRLLERDNTTLLTIEDDLDGIAEAQRGIPSATHSNHGFNKAGAVQRNAPCPCGSGKRYKQCHGKLS